MKVETLKIIDYISKTATSYSFSSGTNIIVSDGNKIGKSSLVKSIYYTLGFDIKQFPSGWNVKDKVLQISIKMASGHSHRITRQGDTYKVDSESSGMDKNTKYLALYLIYFALIDRFGAYRLPFCMDSFTKNEISEETARKNFSAISKHFLPLKNQVFFSVVTDNLKYLDNKNDYKIIQIEEHQLNKEDYDALSLSVLK
ncbi:hypothetical protein GYN24_00660 [Lactococcus piscium]|uniref:hypothetical protein n=1 Tax=Pseudolactococcus TaxID=3436058 RepID=UPI000D4AF944|nr:MULTISPECIES: hypothetical protein [Lactococcus]MCJ1980444.1 hypothetical protein [Lactococcus carnosus]MCJ1993103.1 hypothetical protein [Lactococcus paracarnosus]SPC38122.1 hypothetical protein LPICM02_70026 [Lactococcus piscium]